MIFMPFFFLGMAALVTWILMLLWNGLMPVIFGLSVITFWQAAGLLILAKILFGGFHAGRRGCCCGGHKHGSWKHKFKHKWTNMSEEDKKRWETKFASGAYCKPTSEEEDSKLNKESEQEE